MSYTVSSEATYDDLTVYQIKVLLSLARYFRNLF